MKMHRRCPWFYVLLCLAILITVVIMNSRPFKSFHMHITPSGLPKHVFNIDHWKATEKYYTERKHVVFLKVAKTGSSTVQGIFLRFAKQRKLVVALPHSNSSLRKACCEHIISFDDSVTDENILPPPPGRHYEILCSHVIYNRTRMNTYFPNDTVYVGIVREPLRRFMSAVEFYKMYKGIPFTNVIKDPFKYNRRAPMATIHEIYKYPLAKMSNNRMAYEFGFPQKLFPTSVESYKSQSANQKAVQDYLKKLDQEFAVILLNEKMDESLVLMKRILNWKMKDILYISFNVGKIKPKPLNISTIHDIEPYLYLDFALYQFAVKRYERQVREQGSEFVNEVKHFKALLMNVFRFCKSKSPSNESLHISSTKWNERFSITNWECKEIDSNEVRLTRQARWRLYKKIEN